ncbi:MAG: hypothetical protein GY941_22340 [Planctomycetes bacterium]|nr:hypothetical protein [Planctomycetota bacterium]
MLLYKPENKPLIEHIESELLHEAKESRIKFSSLILEITEEDNKQVLHIQAERLGVTYYASYWINEDPKYITFGDRLRTYTSQHEHNWRTAQTLYFLQYVVAV